MTSKKGTCFENGSTYHYRDTCPKLNRQKGGNHNNNNNHNNQAPKDKEYKYIAPSDDKTILKRDNKYWQFCRYCKCKYTSKVGLYNLSHTSSEHLFKQDTSDVSNNFLDTPTGNNATIGMDTNGRDGNNNNIAKFKDNKSNEDEDNVNNLQF